MSDHKTALKKLNIIRKYLNFQIEIGAIDKDVAREIKRYIQEAEDCLSEKTEPETKTENAGL